MITLLPDHFELEKVTQNDLIIASLAWGFTLGIGWLTTWSAIQQTQSIFRRHGLNILRHSYFWMIWGEISVCLGFGVICFMYLLGVIPPSFAFYFCILTLWALQVQFLLQIIINRCSILLIDKQLAWRIKVGVATLITAINISVYCIWVPARLQINDTYIHVNEWWDRCEKIIYLLVDAALNIYFIRIVQQNLVKLGLHRYKNLVRFNMFIIGFSLAMDVLIIAMMSLDNTFVYMQFHPLAYIVKLKIELSMADLIAKVAKQRDRVSGHPSDRYYDRSHTQSHSHGITKGATVLGDGPEDRTVTGKKPEEGLVTVTTTIEMHSMEADGKQSAQSISNHTDTDILIQPAKPFDGGRIHTHEVSKDGNYRGGSGSVSSYNSDNVWSTDTKSQT